MPIEIKSKPGLKKKYTVCSHEVRDYFEHVPKLLDDFPMDVCLAYVFSRLELGQNMALYCGAVRIYKTDAELTRQAVGIHHMTRKEFVELYNTVFGFDLPKTAHSDLREAENTRDAIMHGKTTTDDKIRNAIARVLEYAEEVKKQLEEKHKLKPFGNLQGVTSKTRCALICNSTLLLQ